VQERIGQLHAHGDDRQIAEVVEIRKGIVRRTVSGFRPKYLVLAWQMGCQI